MAKPSRGRRSPSGSGSSSASLSRSRSRSYSGSDSRSRSTSRSVSRSRSRSRSYTSSSSPSRSVSSPSRSPPPNKKSPAEVAKRGRSPPPSIRKTSPPPRKSSPTHNSVLLHVESLTRNVNENHLKEIFGNFGDVVNVDLAMDRAVNIPKGYGYVEFKTRADAEKAQSYMDGAQIDGNVVKVTFTLAPRQKVSSLPPKRVSTSLKRDAPKAEDVGVEIEKDVPKRQRDSSPRRKPPSPMRRRSPPPLRRGGSPRRLPDSPIRRRPDSPIRRRVDSPYRRGETPPRRRPVSPVRGRSPSPVRRHRSPLARGSPRRMRGSPPPRRRSPLPLRRRGSPPPRRARSPRRKGEMMSMIYNWPGQQVDMIVLTDGSRILGLGDLGVQGIGIPIGKLDVYVAAAGINPQKILPVMLDVGTNNQKLLEDRLYLGLRQLRLEGEEYLSIVDEFMEAVFTRWPKAIVQFEDFQMKWAFETLERYRKKFRMFNDDIQGTAGVALAGLLGTVRAQGRPLTDFVNQKIVVVGAGSAGLGVLNMAVQAVSRMAAKIGTPTNHQFFLLDKDGLITKERKNIDPAAAPFAKGPGEFEGLREGASLLEVVKKVKPHVLLGLSGVGGVFSEEVLRAMRESDSTKPAIFAMSNPTKNAECTAVDAFKHAGENIVFASGSPFTNIDLGNGKVGHVNQANNMYLFPGIGLGTLLSGAHFISDGMLQAASECLASYMTDEEVQKGILYPSVDCIRQITAEVGAAVIESAVAEELAEGHGEVGAKELMHMSKEEIIEYVKQNMWFPIYSPLVHEK